MERSDEVVTGTAERVIKAGTVDLMPAGQRGDARYAKSIRGVPWRTNTTEAAEGEPLGMAMTRIVSVPMVPVEHRPVVPVMEPREYKNPSVLHPVRSGTGEVRSLRCL